MNIKFSNKIKDCLGSVSLGIVEFTAKVEDSEPIFWDEVNNLSIKIRERINLNEITKQTIISETRKAYKKCGKDPSRYRPSADSLIRRIVKGNELYRVNNVVDVLNIISIESGYSIGSYDKSNISGDVTFDVGSDTDEYYGIGRGLLNIDGLPVLRDKCGVFGSPTSDSERTMITKSSNEIAFVFFDFSKAEVLQETIQKAQKHLAKYCLAEDFRVSLIDY